MKIRHNFGIYPQIFFKKYLFFLIKVSHFHNFTSPISIFSICPNFSNFHFGKKTICQLHIKAEPIVKESSQKLPAVKTSSTVKEQTTHDIENKALEKHAFWSTMPSVGKSALPFNFYIPKSIPVYKRKALTKQCFFDRYERLRGP